MAVRGALITVEGIDGSGKSTLCEGLSDALGERVTLLREPGGVPLSERVRELVKDPDMRIGAAAEALLFAAARAQLVSELVEPLLTSGRSVLLDRFVDSSLAYQGAGRGLGIDVVRAVNLLATGDLRPDLTLLVRVAPELARARRGGGDRIEDAGADFFATVAKAYDRLAAAEPDRFRVLDGAREREAVLDAALKAIGDVL